MKTSRSIEASKSADPSHSGHGVEASRASSSEDGTAQRGGSLSRRGSRTSLPRTSSARPAKSVTLPEGKAFLVVTLLFLLSLIMAAHLFRPRDILLDVDEMDLPMTDTSFSRQASLGIPPTPSLDDDRSRDAKQLQNSTSVTSYGLVAQSAPSPPPVHPASPLAVLKPASSWDERGNTCNMALELDRVALLFLTKGDLFHHQTWSAWFRSAQGMLPVSNVEEAVCNNFTTAEALRSFCDMTGTDSEGQRALDPDEVVLDRQYLFSVYVHAPPNIADKDMRPLFKGRLIKDRIYTGWGSHQLVEAERNLLWHAYQDPANTRFVLLSESDIPLYHPLVLYSQVMAENLSRVNACKSANQDHRRWSWRMSRKGLKSSHWRKSSQWFMLIREHATLVLNDTEVFRSFEAHCRGGYDSDYRRNRDCFSDEHYLSTLLASRGVQTEENCEVYGITSTEWAYEGWHPHPHSYAPREVNAPLIRRLRGSADSCKPETLIAEAMAGFVHVASIAPYSGPECEGSRDAGPILSSETALPSTCYVLARKFPKITARLVYRVMTNCSSGLDLLAPGQCLEGGEMWMRNTQ